ncbi:hypothetical protein WMY93_023847 [Mugilogobius chulae]|uniref:CCR4-NOT transcription complex subunit 4 n=1 Tax=Mugilogobius chulae TaxID=88201 RepID=A0AAW0N5E0_9GOBI
MDFTTHNASATLRRLTKYGQALCSVTNFNTHLRRHRMSHSPEMKDDPMECPLCMEPLEIDDVNFFPCTCGYQICRFCWHRIRTDENGLCPACRKNEKKQKVTENRKHLASVRVVQRNLVFVVGLSQRLADPECSAYVTYIRPEDALRAIQCVNNVVVDGRTLKASLGTTKYCSYFLKSMQCPKPDCMYLHELGDEAASFTKEEMQAGKHQEYEQKLLDLCKINPSFQQPPTCATEKSKSKTNSTQRTNNSNGKDGWPTLPSGHKLVNGLSEDRKSPPLLDYLDQEGLTSDGLDSELASVQRTALSPFSSNCDSNSPSDKPPESIGLVNGDTLPQMPTSDSPSPPPGLTKPSLVVPISVSDLTAARLLRGQLLSPSPCSQTTVTSDIRTLSPPASLHSPAPLAAASDWPMTPEPQSLFTSDTIPVSSSTDWQAAFGFGSSSKQQDDDLGFDPFDVTRKALADLIEKELSVQDQSPSSPGPLAQGTHHGPGLLPLNPSSSRHPQLHHRAIYNSFSFPGSQANQASSQQPSPRHPWMSVPTRNNLTHLNHSASAASHSNFLDLNLPPQHNTGLGGIPISENSGSIDGLNVKEWQDGLRALLPNININFGGLPNSSSSSSSSSSNSVNHVGGPPGPAGISHSLSWDGTASWMDPAIITGIPASGNSLDCLQDDNPPHWLKSLQALTEMDAPTSAAVPTTAPSTVASSTLIFPSHTEPPAAGLPTCPLPQPIPASSTPRPQASRWPSDPRDSLPQSCYRVPLWTATEQTSADTHLFPTTTLFPLILYLLPVPTQYTTICRV